MRIIWKMEPSQPPQGESTENETNPTRLELHVRPIEPRLRLSGRNENMFFREKVSSQTLAPQKENQTRQSSYLTKKPAYFFISEARLAAEASVPEDTAGKGRPCVSHTRADCLAGGIAGDGLRTQI